MRISYKVLVETSGENRPPEKPRPGREDNIKMDVKEVVREDVE
jgi:hypothetical protein